MFKIQIKIMGALEKKKEKIQSRLKLANTSNGEL